MKVLDIKSSIALEFIIQIAAFPLRTATNLAQSQRMSLCLSLTFNHRLWRAVMGIPLIVRVEWKAKLPWLALRESETPSLHFSPPQRQRLQPSASRSF